MEAEAVQMAVAVVQTGVAEDPMEEEAVRMAVVDQRVVAAQRAEGVGNCLEEAVAAKYLAEEADSERAEVVKPPQPQQPLQVRSEAVAASKNRQEAPP